MIPIIDVASLVHGTQGAARVAEDIGRACHEYGFFYVVGHGVDPSLVSDLEHASRRFFDQPLSAKQEIAMSRGGRAWRGYFPVGGELTSGKPDQKEGIYFGAELSVEHPRVRAGTPLYGPNLFPAHPPELRELVLTYMNSLTQLGHVLMAGISLSLGLEATYFASRYTANPLILFRIFNYPPAHSEDELYGVGEHTDYGLLTILKQDMSGGLEIKSGSEWLDAPPVEDSFVCNLGDMLDRMTGGRYLSTPHRVRNPAKHDRISFAFFFDPDFEATVEPIEGVVHDNKTERWDHASVHEFQGTYGDYLLGKVSKVFPELRREVL